MTFFFDIAERVWSHMPFHAGDHLFFSAADRVEHVQVVLQGRAHTARRRLGRAKPGESVRQIHYVPWKIHWMPKEGELRRLETGLPENAVECNACACRDASGWQVSFVGGIWDKDRLWYRLYHARGSSLETLAAFEAVHDRYCWSGFVQPHRRVEASGNLFRIIEPNGERVFRVPFDRLYRVIFRADDPDLLLVTVGPQDGPPLTLQYDSRTEAIGEVKAGGQSLYKASVFGQDVIFASSERGAGGGVAAEAEGSFGGRSIEDQQGREDRHLQTGSVQIEPRPTLAWSREDRTPEAIG